jgi:asparagine synthase (glutamine-hydrolysing)
MLRWLPVSHRHMSVDVLLRQLVRGGGAAAPLAHQIWMGATPPDEQAALLDPSVADAVAGFDLEGELAQRFAGCAGPDDVARLADFYAQTYLQEGVLAKVDRASMSHGLEVRNPFLDRHVVEFVSALPGSYKQHGLGGKRLFKRAARGRLPRETIGRTKHGFGIPQSSWLAGPLKEPLCDLLAPQRLKQQGVFNAAAVQALLDEHFDRRANHGRALWTLLMFQLWHDRWAAVPGEARRSAQPASSRSTVAVSASA